MRIMLHHICTYCAMQTLVFCVLCASQANAAEARLLVRAGIISYADTVKLCGGDDPPAWCPAHLLKEEEESESSSYSLSRTAPAFFDEEVFIETFVTRAAHIYDRAIMSFHNQ